MFARIELYNSLLSSRSVDGTKAENVLKSSSRHAVLALVEETPDKRSLITIFVCGNLLIRDSILLKLRHKPPPIISAFREDP